MRNKLISILIATFFVTTAAVLLPTSINAQLRYQSRYTKVQVGQTVRQLESSSNTFKHDFDYALDHSRINGSSAEDRYNRLVKDYASSLDRLRKEFDRTSSWWLIRSYVTDTISKASAVNDIINQLSFRRNIEHQWASMRNDLNSLADTFDLPGLDGGGWTGGNWNGGGQQGNVPSWAVGTFYGRGQRGENVVLTVSENGSVAVVVNGSNPTYATMNGTTLTNGQYVSRVSKLNNGFRTTSTTNNDYIDYSRNANDGGGWNDGGQQGNVPSWAVGTFYGRGQRGENVVLTVSENGSVAVVVNGSNPTYATMNGTTLTNGQYVSRVSKLNNGFRTTSTTNNDYIDYSRSANDGGGWNGGGQQGNVPSWALGTFYGRGQRGENVVLTVLQNGSVTVAVNGGNPANATMNGTTLTNGPYVSRVTKLRNGIRTTSVSNNDYIDYYRR